MNLKELLRTKEIEDKKALTIHVVLFALGWYLFAHGYRMANNLFSHDSLLEICQDDSAWQIALGRWAQPFLIFLRGGLTNPWLISVCALIFFCVGTCLVVNICKIREGKQLFFLTGILVCNPAIICTNTAFLQCVDFYSFAFLLAVLGVFLVNEKKGLAVLLGIIAMAGSMAVYQAYIGVSIALFMILLYQAAGEDDKCSGWMKRVAFYCGCLLTTAVLYFIGWKIFLRVFGIWTADTYNGMAGLLDFSKGSSLGLISLTYKRVWEFFWNPAVFATMTFKSRSLSIVWIWFQRIANLSIFGVILYSFVADWVKEKRPWWCKVGRILILLFLPLGVNFVCVMSKGMEHTLMVYAFIFVYVFACVLSKKSDKKLIRGILILSLACFVWVNLVYANQVYLKKSLQDKAMTSMMTRIVERVEQTEGYEPGITPVAFSGYFEYSPYIEQLKGFEEINPYGMGKTTLTYMGTDYAFLKYEFNIPLNESRVLADEPRVKDMPCFPVQGSVAYVDDILVVKISD